MSIRSKFGGSLRACYNQVRLYINNNIGALIQNGKCILNCEAILIGDFNNTDFTIQIEIKIQISQYRQVISKCPLFLHTHSCRQMNFPIMCQPQQRAVTLIVITQYDTRLAEKQCEVYFCFLTGNTRLQMELRTYSRINIKLMISFLIIIFFSFSH